MRLTLSPRNRTFGFLDALGLLGGLGFLVARFVPVARLPFWECWLRSATGWPCPGCGLTRAAERVSLGKWWSALEVNPLGTVFFLFLGLATVLSLLHLAFALPLPQLHLNPKEARRVRRVVGLAVVLNYAYLLWSMRFSQIL